MEKIEALKTIASFINNIDTDTGWWYSLELPGQKQDDDVHYLFLCVSKVFGIHKDAMLLYWLESGVMKRNGKRIVYNIDSGNMLKTLVEDPSSFEISNASLGDTRRKWYFKLGHVCFSLVEIWNSFKKYPRRTHPPTSLASREVTKSSMLQIINIIKNSNEFNQLIQIYINHHYSTHTITPSLSIFL